MRFGICVSVACLAVACSASPTRAGFSVHQLQNAALQAEEDMSRCPLDFDFPNVVADAKGPSGLGISIKALPGAKAAAGTPVGHGPQGSALLAAGGATYRCDYQRTDNDNPVSLVVVVLPAGQQPASAAAALEVPLENAGYDHSVATQLVAAAKNAKIGEGVADPIGDAAAASTTLPGGGGAAVAIVAVQFPSPRLATEAQRVSRDMAAAAGTLAAKLKG